MDGDIARPCVLHGLALCLVRDFVGKDDHPVRITYPVHEIPFIAADTFEGMPTLAGSSDVIRLQPIHSSNQGNAHGLLLWPSIPHTESRMFF